MDWVYLYEVNMDISTCVGKWLRFYLIEEIVYDYSESHNESYVVWNFLDISRKQIEDILKAIEYDIDNCWLFKYIWKWEIDKNWIIYCSEENNPDILFLEH